MSTLSKTYWSINGVTFPRNPDNWTKKHNASNVSYVNMADGSIRRIVVPYKVNPAPVELEWHYADERLRNFVLSQLNTDQLYKVTVDGKLPARQIWMYFDTPEENMSKDIYDSRVGQGGMRSDLKMTGMMDGPYQHSANVVPAGQNTVNLLPFTDAMRGASWNVGGYVYGTGGPSGAIDWEYTVSGSQVATEGDTGNISVTPGQVLTFSVWCNPSICSSGNGFWLWAVDVTNNVNVLTYQTGIVDGRKSFTITVPTGCTTMNFQMRTHPGIGVIPVGATAKFSQPQLEIGNSASAYSANNFSAPGVTASQMSGWFGGPTGNNAYDLLPTWNGNSYNAAPTLAGNSFNNNIAFTNLGTAPWSPTIRVNGPFNNGMQMTLTYQDVDGTGQGVVFTYTGPNVASGNYLLIDTQKMRVYSVIGGAKNEIYTFTLLTVANSTPFPYWPPFPTGKFNVKLNIAGATQGTTTLDLSNNGTETFRYW